MSNGFNPRLRTGGDPTLCRSSRDAKPVSIRASAREATHVVRPERVPRVPFQSAPPHGRRLTGSLVPKPCRPVFQSAPPHGRRRSASVRIAMSQLVFQSAPPHGRRRGGRKVDRDGRTEFQSAPPHGRRPALRRRLGAVFARVSIRASAREATRSHEPRPARGVDVSIRASAREATPPGIGVLVRQHAFQSAPPHGRRPVARATGAQDRRVSIRASAREATRVVSVPCAHGTSVSIRASAREATLAVHEICAPVKLFQSAPPHGRRPWPTLAADPNPNLFQSAPPHGRRPSRSGWRNSRRVSFNPRLRTGGDQVSIHPQDVAVAVVSIRASAREATGGALLVHYDVDQVSIRASAREATRIGSVGSRDGVVSIRASAREATCSGTPLTRRSTRVSIRASAREATRHVGRRHMHVDTRFNPRLRTGGDSGTPTRSK